MDYPFFIKPLLRVPDELMERLRHKLLASDLDWYAHPMFLKTKLQTINEDQKQCVEPEVQELRTLLDPWMPTTIFRSYSTNRLMAGDSIGEHSDINTKAGTEPLKYMLSHKLHLPIETSSQVISSHRRSRTGLVENLHMEQGTVYLYNDYCWHGAHNPTPHHRTHLMLKYWDPQWKHRLDMLVRLGYHPHNTYERI